MVVQLENLSFDKGGSLTFNEEAEVSGVQSRYCVDFNTFYQRLCDKYNGDDPFLPFQEAGPFEDPKSYFISSINQHDGVRQEDLFTKGAHSMLRLFIDWGFEGAAVDGVGAFVLAHPDFDVQNIFTTEHGTLTGIVDWDWVAAMPRSIGCLGFPKFLVGDYNPTYYDYDVKADRPEEGCDECSPNELKCYRALYAQFIEKSLGNSQAADVTRRSLVMNSLDIASSNPVIALKVISHLFKEIEHLVDAQGELDLSDIACDTASATSSDTDEDVDEIDDMSFEDCLREIEELTASEVRYSSADQPPAPTLQDRPGQDIELQDVEDAIRVNESYGRKFGRITCNWASKKFRGVADTLHRKENNQSHLDHGEANMVASESTIVKTRKIRATRSVCCWAQIKINRLVDTIHCNAEPEDVQGREAVPQGGAGSSIRSILSWLHNKLKKLVDMILEKSNTGASNIKGSARAEASQNEQHHVSRQKSDRSIDVPAYGHIARLLREDELLAEVAQRAVARWVVRTMRSEVQVQNEQEIVDYDPVQALEEYLEDQQAVISFHRKRAIRKASKALKEAQKWDLTAQSTDVAQSWIKASEYSFEGNQFFSIIFPNHNQHPVMTFDDVHSEHDAIRGINVISSGSSDGDNNSSDDNIEATSGAVDANAMDKTTAQGDAHQELGMGLQQLEFPDQSSSASSDGSNSTGLTTAETSVSDVDFQDNSDDVGLEEYSEYPKIISVDRPALDDKDRGGEGEDYGNFDMFDICIALAKGNLDEQRMKRLREGFFALLNQTL